METIIPIVILFSLFLVGVTGWNVPISISGGLIFLIILGIGLLFFLALHASAAQVRQARSPILKIFLVALILRLLFTIVYVKYMEYTTSSIFYSYSDEVQYEELAWALAQDSQRVVKEGPAGFTYILGGFYSLFGRKPFLGKISNCFLGALTSVYVYLIASKIHSPRSGYLAGMLFAFQPFLIRWSAYLQKDVCIGFLISLMVWEAIKEESLFYKWIITIISGILLLYVRITVGVIVFPSIVIYLIIISRSRWYHILTVTASGALVFTAFWVLHSTGLYSMQTFKILGAYYNNIPLWVPPGTAIIQRVSPIGALQFALTNPVRILYNVTHIWLAPLPWKITDINNIPLSLTLITGWIMLMIMIPAIIFGSRHLIRLRQREVILFILIIVALSLIHSIIDNSWRYRSEFMPLAIVLAAIGFTCRQYPPFEKVMAVLFLSTVVVFNIVCSTVGIPSWFILPALVLATVGFVYKKLRVRIPK